MPGFALSRFGDAIDFKEFTCTVCRDLLRKPMVTACCRQAFCESCIKTKRACPYDRKSLTAEALAQPPQTFVARLNALKMKCGNAANGCTELITPETVEAHEQGCPYGKNLCGTCSFAITGQHVCQKAIADFKAASAKELEEANALLRSLHTQVDNYNRTVRELTLDRTRAIDPTLAGKAQPTGATRQVTTNKDLITEAQKYVNSAIVDRHKTPRDIVNKVCDLAREAVVMKGEKIYEVTRFIKDAMDAHYVGDWNVYLFWNNLGFAFHNVCPESFVEIKFGKVSLVVYKSFDSLGFNRMVSMYKAGSVLNFVVAKTGFDEAMTREIEKLTLAALKNSSDTIEFTDKVTTDLMAKFGSVWHCFIYRVNFGFYCVRSEKGRFCLLSNSEAKILLFQ